MDDRLAQALEIVVARTKHERFRQLCDPAHPDHHPGYAAEVFRLAGMEPPAPEPETAAQRRARKPRMALGVSQKPPPGCKTCGQPRTERTP